MKHTRDKTTGILLMFDDRSGRIFVLLAFAKNKFSNSIQASGSQSDMINALLQTQFI
jgi:hypothetical protein